MLREPSNSASGFTLVGIFETVADAVPSRVAVIQGERRLTYADLALRARRLASYLHSQEAGAFSERTDLAGHQSGQDHLAIMLYNGPEYIEGMLGAYGARVAPMNVNYRYVGDELRYLIRDANPRAFLYHATFASVLEPVLGDMDSKPLLIQVQDASGNPLLPGAIAYEEALEISDPSGPPVSPHPDDLYILYTRPSERWGQEVFAIVEMAPDALADQEELNDFASQTIARFKLPKSIRFVDQVQRSPSGKADYRWARAVANEADARLLLSMERSAKVSSLDSRD
jgi:acyl-CoA synthetase (AMP-forming)/AMP-acid ligase II